MNIYQRITYRKDLSWVHFNDKPRIQEKHQGKDQQIWSAYPAYQVQHNWSSTAVFLVYPTNTSSNQEQQPRHENKILYTAVWQIYRDTEQPHKKKTSQNKSRLQFSWRQYQQQIKCKSFNPIWKRNSSPQEEAYQLFLKNRPIHFHIDSTSFIRPVKQNLLSFIIKRITKSLIIFKKPRKITKDFFNDYIFVYTFQWTSSECFINVTITVKITMAKEIISHLSRFLKNG